MRGQSVQRIRPRPVEGQPVGRYGPPPLPPQAVNRVRLFDVFERGRTKPLTLVSAPAGAGKTVAVASWLSQGPVPTDVAWISLTENALAGASLLSLVAEALTPPALTGRAESVPVAAHAERLEHRAWAQ